MMHDHRQQTNNMLVITATLVVAGLIWYMAVHFNRPAPAEVATPADYTYYNDAFGISLRYGPHFTAHDPMEIKSQPWRMGSATPGERFLTIVLPGEVQPSTNLRSVQITLGASGDPAAVKGCLVADQAQGEILLPGGGPEPDMMHFQSLSAGAGNHYEVNSYRTMRDTSCIALESIVHTTNLGNYEPAQGIVAYDHPRVQEIIDRVIETFRFIP